MAHILAIAMQKGGVGKTTTTINLSAALVERGYRVLAIDLDPQGNLTQHAGFDPEQLSPTIYDGLRAEIEGQVYDSRAIVHGAAEGFDLMPSQPELSMIELSLMNTLSRERVLDTFLEDIRADYDYVLIDCGPSLNLLVINALTAANSVIIPVQTEYLAARGAFMILSTIETVRQKKLNPDLYVEGILLTMADTRTLLTKDILAAVDSQFGTGQYVFQSVIKRSVRFGESVVAGQSILAYDPQNPGAQAYRDMADEVLRRGEAVHSDGAGHGESTSGASAQAVGH